MIGRSEAAELKKSLTLLPSIEREIDGLIKAGIVAGKPCVSKAFDREAVAETVAGLYRSHLWAVGVSYTGSDRAYSPRDEWTVTIDLTAL